MLVANRLSLFEKLALVFLSICFKSLSFISLSFCLSFFLSLCPSFFLSLPLSIYLPTYPAPFHMSSYLPSSSAISSSSHSTPLYSLLLLSIRLSVSVSVSFVLLNMTEWLSFKRKFLLGRPHPPSADTHRWPRDDWHRSMLAPLSKQSLVDSIAKNPGAPAAAGEGI